MSCVVVRSPAEITGLLGSASESCMPVPAVPAHKGRGQCYVGAWSENMQSVLPFNHGLHVTRASETVDALAMQQQQVPEHNIENVHWAEGAANYVTYN